MADAATAEPDGLDAALAEAHVPTLVMALVHMTGETDLLRRAMPTYRLLDDKKGALPPEFCEEVRGRARRAVRAHRAGAPMAPPPDDATVRRMIDFITGTEVPERYLPYLLEELSLDGRDPKRPDWTEPALAERAGTMHAVIVGAGMSGLLAAIRLREAGIAFTIIEKNPDVGGTWFENTYPGCRVDSTNHMYSYSFLSGHEWPQWYSRQDVLLEYFRGIATRYGLRDRIRFGTGVEEAVFDEARNAWDIRLRRPDGERETIRATVLISAVGQLNEPRLPDIPGLDRFGGAAFHSARWRHDVALKGKRIGVIGTGASAFQFIPEIAPDAAHLTIFQRNPPWMLPTANYHQDVGAGVQWLLRHVPLYAKWWRFFLFWMATDGLYAYAEADADWDGPDTAIGARNMEIRDRLAAHIAGQMVGAEHLLDHVIPRFPFGGKRSLRDNGVWLATLRRDDVSVVTDPIAAITPEGVTTADGTSHVVDVLIYGTGFHASEFLRTFKVTGRGGRDLHEFWDGDARAHLGLTVPGFPNFFMLYGPNTNVVSNGSVVFLVECGVRYMLDCIKMLARSGGATVEVRSEAYERYNRDVDAGNARMAWGAPQVSSWYKNAKGRVTQNWPFRMIAYWEATRRPDPADHLVDGAPVTADALEPGLP